MNPTGRRYHDPESGERLGTAPVTVGAVASYFSWKVAGELWLPALSVQVPARLAFALSGPA